ncbi:hypothetical protein [Chitinophaga sp.]|uniref:hypothetical protein n=1 Tax=Chitinophaga sp. TaxID=1869181 RepID=UPI0031D1B705
MSYTIANYTFLPWLRQGIANKITAADNDAGVKVRAKIKVDFKLDIEKPDGGTAAETFSKDVELYGPGDIIGIDAKVVIKHDPMNWITDYEPNYLPYIEFYDESFPWRYTPAAPGNDRLRPWLALVVIKEGEFEEAKNIQGKPLSYITVPNAATKFPPADQLWAWAHVHVSESLMDQPEKIVEADTGKIAAAFQAVMNRNPDLASSRILCPMKLENNAAYHAFLIPTFETGRLAGLGLNPADPNMPHATFSAWGNYNNRLEPDNFPVYYRWFFRTGDVGDFEYLVRLLKPQPIDKRVGRRDIDVQYPGSNLRGITNPELGGVLKLGGALKVPFATMTPEDQADVLKYDNWDQNGYPQPFQKDLATFINLADDYYEKKSEDANAAATDLDPEIKNNPDPLITPPLYGRWHALQDRLLTNRDGSNITQNKNWVHQLNLDPRWRVSAGYGTRVVQENQEAYMEAAWQQVGDVLEANRKLRYMHFARLISTSWYRQHVQSMVQFSAEKALLFTAPVQRRVLDAVAGVTVQHQVDQSVITRSLTSPTMRKLIRPGGRAMKKSVFTGEARPDNLVTRVNEGQVVIAPPKVAPETLPTVNEVADDMMPKNVPSFILDLIRKWPWLKWALIIAVIILILLMLVAGSLGITALLGIITAGLILLLAYILKWSKAVQFADSISEENQTPDAVDDMPKSPDFVLSEPGGGFNPTVGTTDSVEAVKFKLALKESLGMVQTAKELGVVPVRPKINIAATVDTTFKALDPKLTIPKHVFAGLHIPERIRLALVEDFVEVMEYPKIDLPMYEPLKKMSKENFLPNLNFIGQNTISLMETNQRFIESYMIGLNHEFSRELLWREYPTDQRGSYFRQFWDVEGYFDDKNRTEEQLKEDLKDIPPIHRWSKNSGLGDHDHREEAGDKEEEVVLVIRGELLKKYPNAVIYAHKAAWETDEQGNINNKVERKLAELAESEKEKPPRNKVKSPLYEARVEPDLYFFGFDLNITEALGATGESQSDIDKPGWFFCIKERPGEPRYGLDIDQDGEKPEVWNDLAWNDVMPPNAPAGAFIPVGNATIEQDLNANGLETDDSEKVDQRKDDLQVFWKKNMNAADVAYILYQVPVLMAVHAGEMLPKQP